MNILKVLGAVVAAHAVAYIIIASPGCSSAPAKPDAQATAPKVAPEPAPAPALASADLNPAMQDPLPISLNLAAAPGGEERAAPTRPGQEAAVAPAEVTPAKTYEVRNGDSLWTIAKKNGLSVGEIAAANNLSPGAPLRVGQKLVIPGKSVAPGSSSFNGGATYTVKSGDTLSKIAALHHTTPAALRSLNRLATDQLQIGQILQVPGNGVAPAVAPASTSVTLAPPPTLTSGGLKHTVAPGETLGAIARRYKVTAGAIATANGITDPAKLRAGQELLIPGGAKAPAPAPAPATGPAPAPAAPTLPAADTPVLPVNGPVLDPEADAPVVPVDEAPRQ